MNLYFGIVVFLVVYGIGMYLFKKLKGFFLFIFLFVVMVFGIVFLKIGYFFYEEYSSGGKIISFFLELVIIVFVIFLYK